jgi:hypothetical protein
MTIWAAMQAAAATLRRLGRRQSGEDGRGSKRRKDQFLHFIISLFIRSGDFGYLRLNDN